MKRTCKGNEVLDLPYFGLFQNMLLDFQSHVSYFFWQGDEATRWMIEKSAFDLQKERENILCPDCLCCPSSLLSSGYRKLFPGL